MSFNSDIKEELMKQKIWNLNSSFSQEEQIKRITIRETFLKSGSLTNPSKDYHLEVSFSTKRKAEEFSILLEEFDIKSKILKRINKYITYMKDGEEISKFLALIGAGHSVLSFEEVRVLKETRNNINRKVNCETANINKTVNAAVNQIASINALKRAKKFNVLPETLKEIAELRVENPEASLSELGKMIEKPISKSGVNHRLNKIIKIAEELE